jgi:hypothetical protein
VPSRPRVRMPLSAAAAAAVLVATMTLTAAPASSTTIKSTVFTHGENGWPCYRIPGTLSLPFGVMLSFAAARSFTGDVRCTQARAACPPRCLRCSGLTHSVRALPAPVPAPQHCYPLNASYPKRYSARVVKRSTDRGASCELNPSRPPHGRLAYTSPTAEASASWLSAFTQQLLHRGSDDRDRPLRRRQAHSARPQR